MKIYTNWEPAPSRMLALARLLAAAGPSIRDDIESLLQPPAVRASAPTKQARATLDAAVECKLVEVVTQRQEQRYALSATLSPTEHEPATMAATLPIIMRRLLLNPEKSGAPDAFAMKCAWFLAQPIPMEHRTRHDIIEALEKAGVGDDIKAEERLEMLVYWMRYVGVGRSLGSRKGDAFVPDPTDLVAAYLPTIFGKASELTIDSFIDCLGKQLPILDGGSMHLHFAKKRAESFLSDSLTIALLRLEEAGDLSFSYPPDAKTFRVLRRGSKMDRIAKLKYTAKSR